MESGLVVHQSPVVRQPLVAWGYTQRHLYLHPDIVNIIRRVAVNYDFSRSLVGIINTHYATG